MSDDSDSDWTTSSEEEEEPSVAWEADTSALVKDTNLNVYKPKQPAWTLGRRDDRELEDKCAPGPGVYESAGEQQLRFYSRRTAHATMAGKPLVLMGQSPGPSDYDTKLRVYKHEHPKWTIRGRGEGQDPIENWLKKVPAPNLYRVKVDQVKESHRRYSILKRPVEPISNTFTPGPTHYDPQLVRKDGSTFGCILPCDAYGINQEDRAKTIPSPTSYSPSLVTRISAPAYTWAKGPTRFPGMPEPKKQPNKKKAKGPQQRIIPRQNKSSLLRANMQSRTSQMRSLGSGGDPSVAPPVKDIYDESGDGEVWPKPETCSKEEDVKILKDKYRSWAWRPASGKALSRRDLRLPKNNVTWSPEKNPYTVYRECTQRVPGTVDKKRGQRSMEMFKKFTDMGVS
mmetsp:Transcript_35603/g.100785  ORF Transcript_35603/g.100785 Transcript_35603/m.100785 type:complete len:398 (+) Transcript_35603:475-1668(+)|eukprot:CAMPEP_0117648508 /NCGR_PEP_ID=MMETSP0804-20121206/444_1 /TAXON_ID=1074897 /ORGANISM="Tetraselmis astigmatica, Strain CCMP880" /LENGTH=397 /DNA_ID=CAMNT_0005454119 /DNA_START=253 /DNA_END=1446 /DNA_ORIENTATION=-